MDIHTLMDLIFIWRYTDGYGHCPPKQNPIIYMDIVRPNKIPSYIWTLSAQTKSHHIYGHSPPKQNPIIYIYIYLKKFHKTPTPPRSNPDNPTNPPPELIFGGTSCVNFMKHNAKCYIISTPM